MAIRPEDLARLFDASQSVRRIVEQHEATFARLEEWGRTQSHAFEAATRMAGRLDDLVRAHSETLNAAARRGADLQVRIPGAALLSDSVRLLESSNIAGMVRLMTDASTAAAWPHDSVRQAIEGYERLVVSIPERMFSQVDDAIAKVLSGVRLDLADRLSHFVPRDAPPDQVEAVRAELAVLASPASASAPTAKQILELLKLVLTIVSFIVALEGRWEGAQNRAADQAAARQRQAEMMAFVGQAVAGLRQQLTEAGVALDRGEQAVTRRAIIVRVDPSGAAHRAGTLPSGIQLWVLGLEGQWLFVQAHTSNGSPLMTGWVPRRHVRLVTAR